VETFASYLSRKHREVQLINECLASPLDLRPAQSAGEAIEQKFRIAAALKAEHAFGDWALTETSWADADGFRSGPFRFNYGYQRADLDVKGPYMYPALQAARDDTFQESIYTCSCMAALSALVMALGRLGESTNVIAPRDCYSETLELIERFGGNVRLMSLDSVRHLGMPRDDQNVLFLDSSSREGVLREVSNDIQQDIDLVIFDTTCFWTGSGRIGRVIRWANRSGLPLVLVRSHTKLDSLGIEYGRLGSAVAVASSQTVQSHRLQWLQTLCGYVHDAVRLFGGAAVPAHFPPYAGSETYRLLGALRVAMMQRNCRRLEGALAKTIQSDDISTFHHGLYITLTPNETLDTSGTIEMAAALCADVRSAGLPIRHAGSFGFDFVAAEWFRDTLHDRSVIRIAIADLPTPLMDKIIVEIGKWWLKNNPKAARRIEHRIDCELEPKDTLALKTDSESEISG
jgi:hypothetical protein